MNRRTMDITILMIWFTMLAACIVGWIMNIVAIAHTGFSDMSGMLILRVVGIFIAPLGAILGYI